MIMINILLSLPDKYKHFVSAWESVPREDQTLHGLVFRLNIEEKRLNSRKEVTALADVSKDYREKGNIVKRSKVLCV